MSEDPKYLRATLNKAVAVADAQDLVIDKLTKDNAELRAEIARRDAEATRPIEVGDVVQFQNRYGLWSSVRLMLPFDFDETGKLGDFYNCYISHVRIGRAIVMPDGSPATKIEGSV